MAVVTMTYNHFGLFSREVLHTFCIDWQSTLIFAKHFDAKM